MVFNTALFLDIEKYRNIVYDKEKRCLKGMADMSNKQTQILYTPDTRAIHELGANWQNIVNDIDEYLKSEGFVYDRTLGYIRDGETTKKELRRIGEKVVEIGLGVQNFIALDSCILEKVVDVGEVFRRSAEMEKNGQKPDFDAMLKAAFGIDQDDEE